MASYFVYVLYSRSKGTFYHGRSEEIDSRLKDHNSGKVKSTKNGTPWVVIYSEEFETHED
jgi:putative endonuclease